MKAYYLKFASEEEAKSVLYTQEMKQEFNEETMESVEVPMLDEEGNEVFTPNFVNISIIGTMYNDDGVYGEDAEGLPTVVSAPTAKDGYHVNVLPVFGEDTSSIQEYSIKVNTPSRVWGGK